MPEVFDTECEGRQGQIKSSKISSTNKTQNLKPKIKSFSSDIANPANDTSSDFKSTFVDALPDIYLLPTPHHQADNQSCVQGLSHFLDSTCDSVKSGVGSGRVEFPSGVDFLITPKLLRVDEDEQVSLKVDRKKPRCSKFKSSHNLRKVE